MAANFSFSLSSDLRRGHFRETAIAMSACLIFPSRRLAAENELPECKMADDAFCAKLAASIRKRAGSMFEKLFL
jgi:hypothetical protein